MGIFDGAIKNIQVIDENDTFKMNIDDLHIAFGIDKNFVIGMGVCMTSLMLNHLDKKIVFHVFTDEIELADIERLKVLSRSENVKIQIYYIDKKIFEKFPTTREWTYATYYRFIMGETLYGIVERVFYLDADILCLDSLEDILEINMEHYVICGVGDFMSIFSKRIEELEIKNGNYFNAGMMYIDINKWNQEEISQKAIGLLQKDPGKYKSLDQDVLNVLLDNKTKFIDKKYNYIYNMGYMVHSIPKNIALIHFAGDKPWQSWSKHHFAVEKFEFYKNQSLWEACELSQPVHYKEMHRMSKSYKKKGMYLNMIKWYFRYLAKRCKS